MTRDEATNLWGLYVAEVGEIPQDRLRELAFSRVPDLADEIKQMDGVFDEKYADHAIAYEVRHGALCRLVDLDEVVPV